MSTENHQVSALKGSAGDLIYCGVSVAACLGLHLNGVDVSGGTKLLGVGVIALSAVLGALLHSPSTPSLILIALMPVYGATGIAQLLMVIQLAACFLPLKGYRYRFSFSTTGLLFCAMAIVSQAWIEDVDLGPLGFLRVVLPMMAFAILISGHSDENLIPRAGFLVMISCIFGAFATVQSWRSGVSTVYNDQGRYESYIQPDIYAGWAVFGVLTALALLLDKTVGILVKLLSTVSIPILLVGIVLSGFRGPILALGIGVVVLIVVGKQWKAGIGLAGIFLITVASLLVFVPSLFETLGPRLANVTEDGGSGRLDIWSSGLSMLSESPIFGIGWDGFPLMMKKHFGRIVMAHNIYLSALIELGVVGFVLLLVWCKVLTRKALLSSRCHYILPCLVGLLVQGFVMPQFFLTYFWVVLGLAERRDRIPEAAHHEV